MSVPSTIIIFPGQGGFTSRLWQDLAARPELKPVLEQMHRAASEESQIDLLGASLESSTASELSRQNPGLLQVLIHATSILAGTWEIQVAGNRPTLLMGHSLGEIAALCLGGAYTPEQSMRIVCRRSAALTAHQPEGGAMLAVGAKTERAAGLIALLDSGEELAVAGTNGPVRTVLSGGREVIETAANTLRGADIVATSIPSPWAFHHPMLVPAAETFYASITDISRGPLTYPVHSPVLGHSYDDAEDLARSIAEHFTTPFDFGTALSTAAKELSSGEVIDAGGGGIITALSKEVLDGNAWSVRGIDLSRSAAPQDLTGLITGHDEKWLLSMLNGGIRADETKTRAVIDYWTREGRTAFSALARETSAVFQAAASAVDAPGTDAPTDPAVGPLHTPASVSAIGPGRDEVVGRLAGLYAEALEYPVEVFTEELGVQLEADLGVDSVKQTDLLARVAQEFGMPIPNEGFSVAGYPTFGSVVELVLENGPGQSATGRRVAGDALAGQGSAAAVVAA